ncbi:MULTISPECIES: NgoMIV family type II restriction endonuclease [Nocardia]|uniref:NgoMIV family type II restriction endonuclease n=1 Tax=Nocardia abscessus TaxID=120957 RepID=UPI002B4AB2C3|nr:NgoMIV family type II restriction endonuclease [Nocardia abscessus]
MTAPFAATLCGYRNNGNPSTSDNSDAGSIEWGHAMFQALGVEPGSPQISNVGTMMESAVAEHLESVRPDLIIRQSRPAMDFEQYRHLGVFRQFQRSYRQPSDELELVLRDLQQLPPSPAITEATARIQAVRESVDENHGLVSQLVGTMPEESMLKIDITVGAPDSLARLLVGLSSKWTLRTDRAQDCISQGAKLVNLRRGHMPHYAVLTMEPRPAMLKLIAYGSGAVDCVYHLALAELRSAAETIEAQRGGSWSPRVMLERMVAQRRVRPYQELVDEIKRLPICGTAIAGSDEKS